MANEKTCVIVSSGPDCDWERLRGRLPADAFVICADGGYAHCARLGLSCSLLVGDMDSFSGDADKIRFERLDLRLKWLPL